MEGREGRDPGYDDWFDEPEPPTQEAGRGDRSVYDAADEVWVLPEDEPRRSRRPPRREIVVAGRAFTTAQATIIAVAAIAILVAVLAAAGVFSGGKAAAPPITTPTNPATNSQSTSTATNTTPTVQVPTQQLKPGATGKQVKILQRALNALGFSVGKPDGDYGPNTQSAVEQFQSSKGLAADGIVGQQTLTALQQALSG